ncbi:hypothetical protein EC957_000620 [Mortierella hygrophila]|uniref:LRR-containing protein second PH domain-containing protein n=1 Tax=Mortierella hygrophila TaxID=979708 RepID=A0A9P6F7J4_9FUNG|nr:hypothetical protein EC957_000620 [Mortierella hygrophila]
MASTGLRSPQAYRSTGSASNSDEIMHHSSNGLPQRPPRQSRQRSESSSSPIMTASQYNSHFQSDPYYTPSTHSQSPRPSPRSTPNTYGYQSSQVPPSPMTFQLPPSAMSTSSRDESMRSGSISYPHQQQQQQQQQYQSGNISSASSYRSPHISPGLPSSGSVQMMPPPLALPDSFLEDQSDYAGYYSSDVGILSSPQLLSTPQVLSSPQLLSDPQQQLQSPMNSGNLYPRQHHTGYPHSPDIPPRQGSRSAGAGMALPSPHMTPTTSPLQNDFPNLSLNDARRPSGQPQQVQPPTSGTRSRAYSTTTVSTDSSSTSRNSLVPRSTVDGVNTQEFYHGQPHVPIESFLMPSQEQYPADSLILFGGTAVHSEGGLFRKDSKEYLMLTNSSLLKYKSMEKAAKVFGNQSVWSSSSGHQIMTPQQTALISKDSRILSLNSIIGVYTYQPAGTETQIVVEYLVSISSQPATMHFTPAVDQVEPWLKELRQGCNYHAAQAGLIVKGTRQRQWVQDKLQEDHIALPSNVAENHPTALAAGGMWRAFFRAQRIKGVPVQENGVSDSKVGLENKAVVIAVGASHIHILPHNLGNSSSKDDLKDERNILQYPILTIRTIHYKEKDDTFTLAFGTTLRQRTVVMTFASARAREIIIAIRARVESLRWLYPLGRKGIELALSESMSRPIPVPSRDHLTDLGFDELLRAECHAMGLDRKVFKNVVIDGFSITVGKAGDNPDNKRDYSVEEMKCLLRALRFNTTFKDISFHDISFENLQKSKTLRDGTLRYGLRPDQEFYELIMGNPQIRVLNLHGCRLDTSAIGSIGRAIRDGYTAGLRLELLDLYGNHATDGADVMTLAKGIVKHAGTLHYLDVGHCQITGDGINQVMHAFVANPDVASHTLEFFGIQGNPESKVNSFILDMFLKHSMCLEKLDLSDLTSWSKSPILMAETLANCGGFLKRLDLSGMALHPSTLDQILSWISSPECETLEQLKVEGCGLDGSQFASILDAVGQSGNQKIEICAGRNLLSDGQDLPENLVNILSNGETATSLGLRRTCWSEQALRQLFLSLSHNFTLKKLDLCAVSLASGRDPDVETCKLLGQMLASEASRLEELLIRGEETDELTSRMGRNLWRSFQGLGSSRYLTKLDVRRNRFKDEGALALAEALRINQSLVWLDMDENDVTVDGFNAILSAFHQGGTEQVPTSSQYYNSTLAYFEPPVMDVSKQTSALQEAMLETYKSEQETRFLLNHATGKDAAEWKERLAQILRQRQQSTEACSRIEKTIVGIAMVVDRNKAAMEAVIRDRQRRRERERDRELLQQRRDNRRA